MIMKKKLTKEQRRIYADAYLNRKAIQGWRMYSFLLPQDIGEQLRQIKNELMENHRKQTTL